MRLSRSFIKRTWAVAILFFSFLMLPQSALAQKVQFSIFGGINHVFQYGSEENYVLGENDFPVTPSHTPAILGASLAYFFSENLGLEADGRYTLSTTTTLVDPSDQDTVEVDTSKHFSLTLNLIYLFSKGNLKPYIVAGGGFDSVSAEEMTYISEYEFEITVEPPESTTDALANFGAGLIYSVGESVGIRLDVRYVLIFAKPESVKSLNAVIGVSFRF
ncbi:outer membrane beta-barrel protein [Acidobacteriota bacterium]